MKRVLLLAAVAALVIGLAGCGTIDRLVKDSGKSTVAKLLGNNTVPAASQTSPETTGETISVKLFFAEADGKKLVAQERKIPKTLSLARETISQLFNGPQQGSDLLAVAPAGTNLLDIDIKDGTAIVDLSKEIQEPLDKVSSELTVEAIVDTLTQFDTVKQVKFRVEGQSVAKIGDADAVSAVAPSNENITKHPITQEPVSVDGTSSDSTAISIEN